MTRSIRGCLLLAVIGMCFITSCAQAPMGHKLIEEINAAKVKARNLGDDAERKRTKAKEKGESGDRDGHDRLIEEAAKLFGQASDTLYKAAENAVELAKLKSPPWWETYFSLQSKLIRNLAQLGAAAHDELLIRKNGAPTEPQVQLWKETIKRITKENEEFRRQITAIESRQGIVLIKE